MATFDGEYVTLHRRPGHRGIPIEQRLPVGRISAVEWVPAGAILDGCLRFVVSEQSSTERWTVSFWRRSQAGFEQLRDAVQAAITRAAPEPELQDRLRRLGHLRDAGILTDTEFQGRKQQLLQAEP